jgi:hypothetical protein
MKIKSPEAGIEPQIASCVLQNPDTKKWKKDKMVEGENKERLHLLTLKTGVNNSHPN